MFSSGAPRGPQKSCSEGPRLIWVGDLAEQATESPSSVKDFRSRVNVLRSARARYGRSSLISRSRNGCLLPNENEMTLRNVNAPTLAVDSHAHGLEPRVSRGSRGRTRARSGSLHATRFSFGAAIEDGPHCARRIEEVPVPPTARHEALRVRSSLGLAFIRRSARRVGMA
jgi:hypothetical protein